MELRRGADVDLVLKQESKSSPAQPTRRRTKVGRAIGAANSSRLLNAISQWATNANGYRRKKVSSFSTALEFSSGDREVSLGFSTLVRLTASILS